MKQNTVTNVRYTNVNTVVLRPHLGGGHDQTWVLLQKELGNFWKVVLGSDVDWLLALIVRSVDGGAELQQQTTDLQLSSGRRQVERRLLA